MDNLYLLMIIALAVLALADLVVGVSNDAVNFLNSAFGSKAISVRTIMIVASLGIALGAIFSSGMMEVARKGIFNPGEFVFEDIMFIFMAVMITDILLLDFFNTLGMPTSTTVSIVFELLGAAVAMAAIKVFSSGGTLEDIDAYINTTKATQIILGIILSVAVSFTIGGLVQWFTGLLLSYKFQQKADYVSAVFGGAALSAISYFILLKGIKGTSLSNEKLIFLGNLTIKEFLENEWLVLMLANFAVWSIISYVFIKAFKWNIYKIIIAVGTFALALAFAGNDLVNFIGVPIAAWQSYELWTASGVPATEFGMDVLSSSVPTPNLLLLFSGIIMVLTLWFSKKARYVADTEINLSREGEARERFQPNFLSRRVVRMFRSLGNATNSLLPNTWQEKIEKQFEKPSIALNKDKSYQLPAFDMVRAAINLTVAGVLISIATSYKLPLSTTYVTFMVAMGTSLADRAWGAESAVYRVAGVLNVIAGWFGTAIIAFIVSGTILYLINFGRGTAVIILMILAALIIARNYIAHNKKSKQLKAEDTLNKAESSSIQGVIEESASNIASVVKRTNKIYTNSINGLSKQDLALLKKNKKQGAKLGEEIEELRDHIFYFIKNLDESSVAASNFYLETLGYLTDISQSLEYIGKVSHKHVNNNHKKLRYNQIKELKELDQQLEAIFENTRVAFETRQFDDIGSVLESKNELFDLVNQKIEKQVERTRSEESSPKNTSLYFSILLESRDLVKSVMELLELYFANYDSSVEPAKATEE